LTPSVVSLAPAATVGVNALTPVIPSTTNPAAAQSGLARTEAITTMVSAANHAIIQRVATGDIEVPNLGRIAVKAASIDGRVDIDMTSDRADTRAVLHASAGALVADLRQADITVRQLRLASDAGSMTPDRSPRDAGTNDTPRRHEPLESERDEQPAEAGSVATVRIVL
jgi:hypothetical protein